MHTYFVICSIMVVFIIVNNISIAVVGGWWLLFGVWKRKEIAKKKETDRELVNN